MSLTELVKSLIDNMGDDNKPVILTLEHHLLEYCVRHRVEALLLGFEFIGRGDVYVKVQVADKKDYIPIISIVNVENPPPDDDGVTLFNKLD